MFIASRRLFATFLLLVAFAPIAGADNTPKTTVTSPSMKRLLLGRHHLSLQWVSWDRFGSVVVTDQAGTLTIKGEQKSRDGVDFVRIDGVVTRVDAKEFGFRGTIVTQVSHINGGNPCVRDGEFTFAIKANRQYWRLQQMDNPCEPVTDYVDVYFRRG
ncbi:MAG: hypothetical protein IPF53_10700 [Blastocatellia bacterium]|nr:hypothetical protein [Blastocatellia bacterium]